jgi:hypothetical protein
LRKGKWKYCDRNDSGGLSNMEGLGVQPNPVADCPSPEAQLYDLEADPQEKDNLWCARSTVAKEMKATLDHYRTNPTALPRKKLTVDRRPFVRARKRQADLQAHNVRIWENSPYSCRIINARGATVWRVKGHGPSVLRIPTHRFGKETCLMDLRVGKRTVRRRIAVSP